MKPERPKRRKLLVASIGVATVSYALAACEKNPPGNLMAPPAPQPTETPVAGNLVAQPEPYVPPDAGPPPPQDFPPPTSGNLVAPPVMPDQPVAAVDGGPTRPRPPTGGNLMPPRHK